MNNNRERVKSKSMMAAITFVCVVVGIVTAVQFKTIAANRQSEGEQNKTLEELRIQLIHEMESKNAMEEEINSLNEKIKILEESSLSEQEDLLKEEYRKAQLIGGLTNVSGAGAEIILGDSANVLLSVEDLLQLINDLRMAEAQAISINDERIVAMSEIARGDYFLIVNGNTVKAPYKIKVIGDKDKIESMILYPFGIYSILGQKGWYTEMNWQEQIQIPKIKDGSGAIRTDLLQDGTN